MKTPSIKTQNNQVMPSGSRLWTPANIGGDLVYWLQPSGISAAVGTDTDTLNKNRWMDSSFNGYELRGPQNQSTSSVSPFQFQTAGLTFGTQSARFFKSIQSAVGSGGGGGSFKDSDAPRIDPGTGAFTIIAVCKLIIGEGATPYGSGQKLTIAADGESGSSSASDFLFQLKPTSNSSSDPSTLVINAKCGSNTLSHTLESKSGTSQVFDEDAFMFGYDRDGSGNAELFNNGTSLATGTGHDADMADTGPRNIFCQVVFKTSGFIYGSDNSNHRIAETICFQNDDANTRILCEGYLAHKYGRQDKLASTHKYRYGPPKI